MINRVWDKIGICASGLCLIHCIATPVLLLAFPASKVSFIVEHDFHGVHQLFAVIVVSSILIAVYPNCRKHGHNDIIAIALIGVFSVLSAIFLHDFMSESLSHGFTIIGSIFLIVAHIKNMKVRHGKCLSSNNKSSCKSH